MMEHYHSIKPLECTVVGSGVVVKVEEEEIYTPQSNQNPVTNTGVDNIKLEVDIKAEQSEETFIRRKRKSGCTKRIPENNIGNVYPKPEIAIKKEEHEASYVSNDGTFGDQSLKTRTARKVKHEIEVKLEQDDQSYVMADRQLEERDSSPSASPDYFLVQVKEEEEDMSLGMDYQQHGEKVVHPQTSPAIREKDGRIHRMSSKMFIDIAQLIQLVQERPELYNPKTPSYADRYKKKKAWDEICAVVVPDWKLCSEKEKNIKAKEVQTRWRSLKDCFRRELTLQKKLESSGIPTNRRRKYIHYDGLLFLEPTMKLRDTPPAAPNMAKDPLDIQQPIDVDQVAVSPTVQLPLPLPPLPPPPTRTLVRASPMSRKNKKKATNENEWEKQLLSVMSAMRRKTEEQADSDEVFLKSLLPFVRKVPEDRKIDMQLSLMQVVKKFMGPLRKEPQAPKRPSSNSTHGQNSPARSRNNLNHPPTSPSRPAHQRFPTAQSKTSFNHSQEPEALPAPPPYSSPSSSSPSSLHSHRDSPYYFDL